MTNFANYATAQEATGCYRMNSMINRLDDNAFFNLIDVIGQYLVSQGRERKRNYNRCISDRAQDGSPC